MEQLTSTWLGWVAIVMAGLAGLLLFFTAFFTFVRFTFVKEGTAKAIVRMKQFRKMVMAWREYKLDENWNVISISRPPEPQLPPSSSSDEALSPPDEDRDEIPPGGLPPEKPPSKEGPSEEGLPKLGWWQRIFGGLRFVGIWPFDQVYTYGFRWLGLELVEGKEEPQFHERILDYVLLRPDVYLLVVEDAETLPPERIPLTFRVLVTIKVINPYKVLFKAPSNWLENAMARLGALVRAWVGTKTLDDILKLRGEPTQAWEDFKEDPLITKTFKDDWGIQIEEKGIEIRTITLHPEYQAAAAAERKQQFEARARAAETVGTLIATMALVRGKREPKEIQQFEQEIAGNPELQEEFLEFAKDIVIRKLGIEGGSYLDVRVEGAEGFEKTLLNALAALKRMPTGAVSKEEESSEKPKKTQ